MRAKLRRIGSPSSKSSDIRQHRGFHRRAFRSDRTSAAMAFRLDRSRLIRQYPQSATTVAQLQAHQDAEYQEACSAGSLRESRGYRKLSCARMLGCQHKRVKLMGAIENGEGR